MINEQQKAKIIEIGLKRVEQASAPDCKCHDFVRSIYDETGVSLDFNNFPNLSFDDIWEEGSVPFPLFLRRKETLSLKRITHMGIIFPNHQLLHCSRWMHEERIYEILLSPFSEVFRVYDFAPSEQKPVV